MVILKTFLIPLQDREEGTVGRSPGRNTGIREKGIEESKDTRKEIIKGLKGKRCNGDTKGEQEGQEK
jgi:hypothetical protein